MSKAKLRAIEITKSFLASLLGATILVMLSYVLESCYISEFLTSNLTLIQITILAINIPTVGIILSNFSQVAKHQKSIWNTVRSSVIFSVTEQIIYIIIGMILMIFTNSIAGRFFSVLTTFILTILQLVMLGMSLATLVDVFQSVISMTEYISEFDDSYKDQNE